MPITKLYVRCSYPMVSGAVAVSDTCQKPACTAVTAPSGGRMWRCAEHRGWYDAHTEGVITEEVEWPYGGD